MEGQKEKDRVYQEQKVYTIKYSLLLKCPEKVKTLSFFPLF
jgi:hypothetical protein